MTDYLSNADEDRADRLQHHKATHGLRAFTAHSITGAAVYVIHNVRNPDERILMDAEYVLDVEGME